MFAIGTVEHDTGIGRDTLRIWERRYGFPTPMRNDKGERVCSRRFGSFTLHGFWFGENGLGRSLKSRRRSRSPTTFRLRHAWR